MRILIFGITGYTGGNIAREALARGHEVVGVARKLDAATPDGASSVIGNIHDAEVVAALAEGVDAIVVSVAPVDSDGNRLADAIPALLAAAAASGARLGIVGGASSLSREPGGVKLIDDSFPEAWKEDALAHIDVLELLRATGGDVVDWFFLSPPEHYGSFAPGERRGSYRVGGDELVIAEDGVSSIGGEDYAIAFLDELEVPAHHRTRFTVGY